MSFTQALARLRDIAQVLLGRLGEGAAALPDPRPPARALTPDPAAAERRITRVLAWLAALSSILAGERRYHRPVRIPPPDNLPAFLFAPEKRAPRPKLPPTEAQRARARAACRLATIRRSFATLPTAVIATRLARRLGLTPADDAWPHALTEITETPAVYALRLYPAAATPPPKAGIFTLLRAVARWQKHLDQILAEPFPLPDTC